MTKKRTAGALDSQRVRSSEILQRMNVNIDFAMAEWNVNWAGSYEKAPHGVVLMWHGGKALVERIWYN